MVPHFLGVVFGLAAISGAVLSLAGCDSAPSNASTVQGVGGPESTGTSTTGESANLGLARVCEVNSDCESGFCLLPPSLADDVVHPRFCSDACEADDDCGGSFHPMVCGAIELPDAPASATGEYCLPSCEDGTSFSAGFACEDGKAVPCAEANDVACRTCGCPENLRCVPEEGCLELLELGETCSGDADCESAHCGDATNLCRVPIGQPCDDTNCDRCFKDEDWSYCSAACSTGNDCPTSECREFEWLGESLGDWCLPPCQDACPGTCIFSEFAGTHTACDCSGCDLTTERPLGSACGAYFECADRECFLGSNGSCSGDCGLCSRVCESDADCDAGFACADTCVATSDDCGGRCLPVCGDGACLRGGCLEMPALPDGVVSVCRME